MKLNPAQSRGGAYTCNRKPNVHKNIPHPSTNNNIPLIIKDNDCRGDEISFHPNHPNINRPIISKTLFQKICNHTIRKYSECHCIKNNQRAIIPYNCNPQPACDTNKVKKQIIWIEIIRSKDHCSYQNNRTNPLNIP